MKIPKLKPKQQVIVTAVVLAVLCVAFVAFFIVPKVIQVGAISVEEQSSLSQLSAAKSTYSQLEELKKTSRKTEYQLMTLERQVPSEAELPALLIQMQDISAKSGITFISIKPATPIQKNNYQEVPLDIQIDGYFFSLLDFVYRIEKLPRIINITSLNIQEGDAKLPNIRVDVKATTFIMTPGVKGEQTGGQSAGATQGGTPQGQAAGAANQAQQQSATSAQQAEGASQ